MAVDEVEIIQTKKKQVFTVGLLTAFVLLVLIVGAIRPSIATIVKLREDIDKKGVLLEDLTDKINTIAGLNIQYKDVETRAKEISLVYPDSGDFSLVMANIEEVANRSGFELSSINFNGGSSEYEIKSELFQAEAVSLNVVGSKSDLPNLMKNLEAMPMFPVIDRIGFANDPDENGNIDFNISLILFQIHDREDFYQ
ncbi:hypothetical protein KC622_00155 [Candidatus Dojkabacteria bacterium]|uniref:Uncharacterized protein n=1 Tax=Candidatus Dojkabacteria bacterium TaxID=2099670 RepID=A0A955I1B9_9BACT|nr:hypothetical protein [Candidatus Dojkabacteria bacterium]MCB9790866.1 hypothetical protein [Candidatus Nomurabacteria bacterium]